MSPRLQIRLERRAHGPSGFGVFGILTALFTTASIGCHTVLRACTLKEIKKEAGAIALRWEARVGHKYRIETADAVAGPWKPRVEVTAEAETAAWSDTETTGVAQRFYRLIPVDRPTCDGSPTGDPKTRTALLSADYVPRELPVFFESSRQIVAEAVFLASQLGASGQRLVTSGTLAQAGQSWNYSATPNDRLVVQFQNDQPTEYVVQDMEGHFSLNAANFPEQQPRSEMERETHGRGRTDLLFNTCRGRDPDDG